MWGLKRSGDSDDLSSVGDLGLRHCWSPTVVVDTCLSGTFLGSRVWGMWVPGLLTLNIGKRGLSKMGHCSAMIN